MRKIPLVCLSCNVTSGGFYTPFPFRVRSMLKLSDPEPDIQDTMYQETCGYLRSHRIHSKHELMLIQCEVERDSWKGEEKNTVFYMPQNINFGSLRMFTYGR